MARREIPETDPNKLREKYPGNSYTQRDAAKGQTHTDISRKDSNGNTARENSKTRTIAHGKVRKQGLLRKFTRYIIEDTVESARERTLADIVVPGIKTLLFDTATDILDMVLFGGTGEAFRGSRKRSDGRRDSRISYSRYYDERGRKSSRSESYRDLPRDPDDIIMDTRQDAQHVLEELDYVIDQYGQASVADFYDIVGVTSNFTDNRYGWTNLRDAGIKPVRDGFMIILPRTRSLDD